jgi:hypothetical protein
LYNTWPEGWQFFVVIRAGFPYSLAPMLTPPPHVGGYKASSILALAGLSLLLPTPPLTADETPLPSAVNTTLASTTLSGYVDTSAQWNPGTGNANNPPYRFGGASKADGFNFNVVQLSLAKEVDQFEWGAGYRVDLWAGPDANLLGTQSTLTDGTSDLAIRQAYLSLRLPVENGLDFKFGVFDTIIGYEWLESPRNDNYTRSYGNTIEPETHTGLLMSYKFCQAFSASFGVANTIGPVINSRATDGSSGVTSGPFAPFWNAAYAAAGIAPADVAGFNAKAESHKTYMGSIMLTAPEDLGFLSGAGLYAGIVNGFNNSAAGSGIGDDQTSYYVGTSLGPASSRFKFGAAFDYLDLQQVNAILPGGTPLNADGHAWSVAGYASFKAAEKLSFHARVECFETKLAGAVDTTSLDSHAKILATTLTARYDLWANVLSRLEFRWDHSLSGNDLFGGTVPGQPNSQNAWMLAANLIYQF